MLSIKWRPSGGRGEYEYKAKGADVLEKRIDVQIPVTLVIIPTDAHFRIKDGKPRLRRENPNDRSILNVPPLVAAIAGLPEPRRQDQGEPADLPLSSKSYVVDEILFDIVSSDQARVVIKPVLLKPRNSFEYVDIEARIQDLVSAKQTHQAVADLLVKTGAGVNDAKILSVAANSAHEVYPYSGGEASLHTPPPQSVSEEVVDEIVEDYVGTEGKVKVRIHRQKERDKKLVRIAKKKFKLQFGKIFCECCGIDFQESYSEIGVDFIEAHHRVPISQVDEGAKTAVDDLAMLCPNCHRMVHKTPDCSIELVQELIQQNNSFINASNVALLDELSPADQAE